MILESDSEAMSVLCAQTAKLPEAPGKVRIAVDLYRQIFEIVATSQLCLQHCCGAVCRANGAGIVFLPVVREPPGCFASSIAYHREFRGENMAKY